MPSLIETRPFTIHPELYAWPSYRLFSERVLWLYVVMAAAMVGVVRLGTQLNLTYSLLTGVGLLVFAFGFSYMRYKRFLSKPETREVFRNCIVSLDHDQVRQDFTDGSFMEIKLFAIKKFRSIGDFYFVIASPKHAIAVPKTAFESPAESEEFAQRIAASVRKA